LNCEVCGWYLYNDGLVCARCFNAKDLRWMADRTENQCKADDNDNTWMIMGDMEEGINIGAHLENKIMLELRKRYT